MAQGRVSLRSGGERKREVIPTGYVTPYYCGHVIKLTSFLQRAPRRQLSPSSPSHGLISARQIGTETGMFFLQTSVYHIQHHRLKSANKHKLTNIPLLFLFAADGSPPPNSQCPNVGRRYPAARQALRPLAAPPRPTP